MVKKKPSRATAAAAALTTEQSPALLAAATPAPSMATGAALYRAEHDLLSPKLTTLRYALFSSQRTGSNYLCRRLCNTAGRMGLPGEYLNPRAIKMMASRLLPDVAIGSKVPMSVYLAALMRARTTEDGAFGVKIQPAQIMALIGREPKALHDFFAGFDRIVLMTRHDKLGQAISGAIAHHTGKWFGDGQEPSLDAAERASLLPVVASNLARYVEEERLILDVGRAVQKPVLRMAYESIEQNGSAAFAELMDFLLPDGGTALNEVEDLPVPLKSSGDVAAQLRKEFLSFIGGQVPVLTPSSGELQ